MDNFIEVKNDLAKFEAEFEKEVLKVFKAGVIQIRNLAGQNAPVDTGALKGDILSYPVETNDKSTFKIGSNKDYADFVHSGTYKIQARPFFDYAIDQYEGEIERMIDDVLGGE